MDGMVGGVIGSPGRGTVGFRDRIGGGVESVHGERCPGKERQRESVCVCQLGREREDMVW